MDRIFRATRGLAGSLGADRRCPAMQRNTRNQGGTAGPQERGSEGGTERRLAHHRRRSEARTQRRSRRVPPLGAKLRPFLSIPLPEGTKTEQLKAELSDGVLKCQCGNRRRSALRSRSNKRRRNPSLHRSQAAINRSRLPSQFASSSKPACSAKVRRHR